MTNNEAISRIKFLLDVGGSDGFTSEDIEALNMAINALSEKTTAPPKSNADRIRQMTDEELAEWISVISAEYSVCRICAHDADCNIYGAELSCEEGIAKWLQKEAENNDKR